MTVQKVHQDSLYFSYPRRRQVGERYHLALESMDHSVFLVLNSEKIYTLLLPWEDQILKSMDHVAVEDIMMYWTMIEHFVLSVIFGHHLPLHGQKDVTPGLHLMLLMT